MILFHLIKIVHTLGNMNRRAFIDKSTLGISSLLISPSVFAKKSNLYISDSMSSEAFAIATWDVKRAVTTAGKSLDSGANALVAAVSGAAIEEADILNTTVGKGGAPDREGTVSLDACVMDSNGNCGAVLAVENITHVAALAKDVMEKTPHVILAGDGARKFAVEQGYKTEDLLSESSKKAWKKWLEKSDYQPEINIENHDTIGMLCYDQSGNLSGSCSTSGLAYKMKGRVGDSPIIGSGLFVDNTVGAAVATGLGEEVIKTVGSFLIVELMRQGKSPQKACEEAIQRIIQKQQGKPNFQVAYVATNTAGAIGAFSIHKGFSYTIYKNNNSQNINAKSIY
jgi:N4-(beta-N-acetylglucosaminyl)-L-asparaginase